MPMFIQRQQNARQCPAGTREGNKMQLLDASSPLGKPADESAVLFIQVCIA